MRPHVASLLDPILDDPGNVTVVQRPILRCHSPMLRYHSLPYVEDWQHVRMPTLNDFKVE